MALRFLPRIERLDLSVVSLPEWHPEAAQGSVEVYGYVIDHPDGAILFDTGVGFGNELIDDLYQPRSARLDEALSMNGVDIESVGAVVNSHLHFDHCGQNPLFHGSDVPIYAQRAEIAEVEGDQYYTDPEWALAPDGQRRVLSGDHEIAEGVTVLSTPGHTPGHQALLVEARDARVVLAGQVVWRTQEYIGEEATPSNVFSDEFAARAVESIRRLKALEAQVTYFAHCAHVTGGISIDDEA